MPRTVLLADDSVTAQNMGRRILMDAGYEVITVNNGSAALKKIHENHPDMIVLDVYMPGYGGLEVCQRLKESGETMRIPVLLTVGKMEPFKAEEAKRVRADAHMVKPFEASELLAALAKLEDRIVPQAEPSRGRKSKKPSFWHEESASPKEESSSKQPGETDQSGSEASDPVEVSFDEVVMNSNAPSSVGAFPLVREASGELPVIADSSASVDSEGAAKSGAQFNAESLPGAPESAEAARTEPRVELDHSVAAPSSASEEFPTGQSGSNGSGAAGPPSPAAQGSRWVAENVALTPEEAALELEQEMRAADAEVRVSEKSSTPEVPEAGGATFAAAAGASGSGTVTAAASNEAPEVSSETVAAWENWQQIRDTVMNVQSTAAIAESVAQMAKLKTADNPVPEAAAEPATANANPSAAGENPSQLESGALASIVDSVLAELKPKLMEEIAKKLKK